VATVTSPYPPAGGPSRLDRVMYRWTDPGDFKLTATSLPEEQSSIGLGLVGHVRSVHPARPESSMWYGAVPRRPDLAALLLRVRRDQQDGRADYCLGLVGAASQLHTRRALALAGWDGWNSGWSGSLRPVDPADIAVWWDGSGAGAWARPARQWLVTVIAARLDAASRSQAGRVPAPVIAPGLDLPAAATLLWHVAEVAAGAAADSQAEHWARRLQFHSFSTFESRCDDDSDPPDVLFLPEEPAGVRGFALRGRPVVLDGGGPTQQRGHADWLLGRYLPEQRAIAVRPEPGWVAEPAAHPASDPAPDRARVPAGPAISPRADADEDLVSVVNAVQEAPAQPARVQAEQHPRSPAARPGAAATAGSDLELARLVGSRRTEQAELVAALERISGRTAGDTQRLAVLTELLRTDFGEATLAGLPARRRAGARSELVWFAIADGDLLRPDRPEQREMIARLAGWLADPARPEPAVAEVTRRVFAAARVPALLDAVASRQLARQGVEVAAARPDGGGNGSQSGWRGPFVWFGAQPWQAKVSIGGLVTLALLLVALVLRDAVSGLAGNTALPPGGPLPVTVTVAGSAPRTPPEPEPPTDGSLEVPFAAASGAACLADGGQDDRCLVGVAERPVPGPSMADVVNVQVNIPDGQVDRTPAVTLSYVDMNQVRVGPVAVPVKVRYEGAFAGRDAGGTWVVTLPPASRIGTKTITLTVTWHRGP
jgi:hypothetical protein